MLSPLEDREVRLWLEAYEPAVDVEVMAHEVLLRSSRPRHQGAVVRCQRTADLQADLTTALRHLVARIS